MSEEWKLVCFVAKLADFSVDALEILLAMVKLELAERKGKVK